MACPAVAEGADHAGQHPMGRGRPTSGKQETALSTKSAGGHLPLDQTARSGRPLRVRPTPPRKARPSRPPRGEGLAGHCGAAQRCGVCPAAPPQAGADIRPHPGAPAPPAVRKTLGTPAAAKMPGHQAYPDTRAAVARRAVARTGGALFVVVPSSWEGAASLEGAVSVEGNPTRL